MITKETIVIDTILKGVVLNKNNEIDYVSNIQIELDKDVYFEYAIVNEGNEFSAVFTSAKKIANFSFKNIDGISQKKMVVLKSSEKCHALITVETDRIFTNVDPSLVTRETLGPTGKVMMREEDQQVPFYQKSEVLILGLVISVALGMWYFSSRKKSSNLTFLD